MKTYSELLYKASLLAEKNKVAKEEARLRGEEYNVYRVCGVNHYETIHSSIIAEWLNPSGSHGQGSIFLEGFIKGTLPNYCVAFDISEASVVTEYVTPVGRIDILITDISGHAIILENKIYASDQDSQLKRYNEFAQGKYGDGNYRILYLTLDGKEASDQSCEGVEYTTVSYQSDILEWLDESARAVCDKPFLRESLLQYRNLIKQLTNQDMDKTVENELVQEMMKTPDSVSAIMKAYPAWERAVIEKSVIEPLGAFAKERGLVFSINDNFWGKVPWGKIIFEIQSNLSIVIEYEKQGRRGFYYGVIDKRTPFDGVKTLRCLEKGNVDWRYGWHYFDVYRDWDYDVIAEIAKDNSKILKYICDAVLQVYEEMKEKNIV